MSGSRNITPAQSDALRAILEEKNWSFCDLPYARWKAVGDKVIAEELQNVPNEKVRSIAEKNLQDIVEGKRDFRF